LNHKDASIPDNAGIQPEGELINRNAPFACLSNMPLLEIRRYLKDAGIPIVISNHAGAYICNAVFYVAANLINSCDYRIKYGFIHIPLIDNDFGEAGKFNITKLVGAILRMLDWL
jgi:pyroglutamyl-peptidase